MISTIFVFLFAMWILIILGGGIAVIILGPISISGYGEFDNILTSVTKGGLAILLSIVWVVILSKIKNLIFKKSLKLQ